MLLHFNAGDSDSGMGSQLTDAAIIRLAQACPNLVHVALDGGRNLGDQLLSALFTNCPNLVYVQLSGNDNCTGDVKDHALNELLEQPSWGKKLIKLRLTDQNDYEKVFQKALKAFSTKMKKLAIEVGCIAERGGGVNTYIDGKMKIGYQAFGGPGGFDRYGGFGSGW